MAKKLISSGAKWESIVGYSRAIKIENTIEFAGTTASLGGEVLFPGNAAAQARYILELFAQILEQEGFSLKDIVRTRLYLTNMEDWQEVGKVHGEFFSEIKPICTLLGIQALVSPDMRIEIEATAIQVK